MKQVMILSLFGMVLSACSLPLSMVTNPTDSTLSSSSAAPSLSSIDPQLMSSALAILNQNCASCHTASSGPAGVYGLNDVNHLFSSGLMVAGDPNNSPLFQSIQAGRMPQGGSLSAADQDVIKNFIIAAGAAASSNPALQPVTPEPTFSYIESHILGPKCSGCHYQGNAIGGYAFDTYTSTLKAVRVNSPTSSTLYQITQSGEMPQSPNPALSSDELNLILTWIQNGAQNN